MSRANPDPTIPPLALRLTRLYRPLRERGALLDGTAMAPAAFPAARGPGGHRATTTPPRPADGLPLAQFMARVRELLAAADEHSRRRLETEVLALAVPLHAAGVFEILRIAHPALAAMVADHLAASGRRRGAC